MAIRRRSISVDLLFLSTTCTINKIRIIPRTSDHRRGTISLASTLTVVVEHFYTIVLS